MDVITIPKKLAQKSDLVVIPRDEYEALLRKQSRFIPIAKLTQAEKRAIEQSEREFTRSEFVTLEELKRELGGTHFKKR